MRHGKALAASLSILLLLGAGFAVLPGASAERTPVMETALPSAREGTSAVGTGDGVYIFGGYDGSRLDEILFYDPQNGGLEVQEATLPSPRTGTAAVWDGTHAYIFGGWTPNGYTDEIVRYDPQTDSIQTMQTTLPSPRVYIAAAWDGTHAYLMGGSTTCSPCASDQILRYDPAQDNLTVMQATLPQPRTAATASHAGGTIAILGGISSNPYTRHDDILHYDPATDSITTSTATLPSGRSHSSSTTIEEAVYHYGGLSCGSSACDTILRYDPQHEQLTQETVLLEAPRQLMGAAVVDGHAYLIGGTGTSRSDQILRHSPSGAPTPPGTPELQPIDDIVTRVQQDVTVDVAASHPDGDSIALTADSKPAAATFTDHGDGTGRLTWTPQSDDVGTHDVTIRASDGDQDDTQSFTITVNPADAPIIERILDRTVEIGTTVLVDVEAEDPEGRTITLAVTPGPTGSTFTDNGDGTGRFHWEVQLDQEGTWEFTASATAGDKTSEEPFTVTVTRQLVPPQLDPIPETTIVAGHAGTVGVHATHPYGDPIALSATGLPEGATFTDDGDGNGTLQWTPSAAQAGDHDITIHATTGDKSDTGTAQVRVIREVDIALEAIDPSRNIMSPGEARTFSARVTNTGAQDLEIQLDARLVQDREPGWGLATQEPLTLASGEDTIVTVDVSVPSKGTFAIIRLYVTGVNETGTSMWKVTNWAVEVPVYLDILVDDETRAADAATTGVEITVQLKYANGKPAKKVTVEIAHRAEITSSLLQNDATVHKHEAKTGIDGTYRFHMEEKDPLALSPGDHTVTATAKRGDRTDATSTRYAVTL